MSADKLSARELAKRLEDHAATHEIIFGKHFRSEEERQAAAELRRQDEAIRELVEALDNTLHELWSARHGYLSRQDFEKEFADELAAIDAARNKA